MEVTQYILSGMTINKTDSEMSWRMVHNGEKVITLFSGACVTESVNTIFLASSLEACQTEIYSLNLEYNP